MTHISLGTALLMVALILHGNISAISGNVCAIASLRRNAIAWLSRPRQMASARFWKKWVRLGEWWLRRRTKSVSSQPIVFRQSRSRVPLPNETKLVPFVAAKRALAHLRRYALTLGTLERSGDTVPILPSRNTSPDPRRNAEAPLVFPSFGELVAEPCDGKLKASLPQKRPQAAYALGVFSCCLKFRLI
jgi:hypothetical protein